MYLVGDIRLLERGGRLSRRRTTKRSQPRQRGIRSRRSQSTPSFPSKAAYRRFGERRVPLPHRLLGRARRPRRAPCGSGQHLAISTRRTAGWSRSFRPGNCLCLCPQGTDWVRSVPSAPRRESIPLRAEGALPRRPQVSSRRYVTRSLPQEALDIPPVGRSIPWRSNPGSRENAVRDTDPDQRRYPARVGTRSSWRSFRPGTPRMRRANLPSQGRRWSAFATFRVHQVRSETPTMPPSRRPTRLWQRHPSRATDDWCHEACSPPWMQQSATAKRRSSGRCC